MEIRKLIAAGAAAIAVFSAGAANAALIFVGSWELNDGPANPGALSAQAFAAQMFGGVATDYSISTAGSAVGAIDHQAWYALIGLPATVFVGGEGDSTFAGFGLSPYTSDPGIEDRFVNYAFREGAVGPGIPEPATWALLIAGFGATGALLRRRRALAA